MSDNILIDEFGFREYDARWLFPDSINELGIESVGKGFVTQVINKVKNPTVIVGHDYRSYSENVKKKLCKRIVVYRMQRQRYWAMFIAYSLFITVQAKF